MKRVLILGAGTAGTMLANHLRRELSGDEWSITVVDRDNDHHYQPGYLFIPFGMYQPDRVRKPRTRYLPPGVDFIESAVLRVRADDSEVDLENGRVLGYDWLLVASGTRPRPDLTPGMADGGLWHTKVFDFYTLEGATRLHEALEAFTGGKLLVQLTDMPIKCPVAPLEFVFLAEDWFRKRGIRHKVDITYVTPLDGAFTKPVASHELGSLLADRSIRLAPDFALERIDNDRQMIVSYDGRELPFDLLVTIPLNTGQQFVIDSGLGDENGFIPVDKATLRSIAHENIFVLGDASNIPTSKAGSVAHFSVETFVPNFLEVVNGKPMTHSFDGHANCFIESGRGQALLLDFNYDTQPLTGSYPLPAVGPMKLLGRSRLNHLGKLAFEQMYWRLLLPGHKLPVPTLMSMAGKHEEE
ncbi:type III sulfide quinone reductase, selenoprotein subtype [Aestuariimicrobium sp. T2.26MG-19.2B]|uniref:type III sulfide quinone reductase, selenoprotein subtype n=1 Tax=Aestuariimicrobium sp. T2.26MG-19.2B TaxID=3040679 RepID=UPI0024774B6D|nr:FAD/NAD(P)-binding oxidoreductase [Aestuariimicrobium sp. T2.26MG-19.2B]CAI9405563.1 Sulfide-quinone reductase [Aestuariimicrobium sp. T2.26MG-19.2B]